MWIIATPCLVLALLSTWWTGGRLAGTGLWPPDEVTLAEAVATRNNAEAVRLIESGADPNRPSHVRDGLLTNGYASRSNRLKPPWVHSAPIRSEHCWPTAH